jgi:hypothetical protein
MGGSGGDSAAYAVRHCPFYGFLANSCLEPFDDNRIIDEKPDAENRISILVPRVLPAMLVKENGSRDAIDKSKRANGSIVVH